MMATSSRASFLHSMPSLALALALALLLLLTRPHMALGSAVNCETQSFSLHTSADFEAFPDCHTVNNLNITWSESNQHLDHDFEYLVRVTGSLTVLAMETIDKVSFDKLVRVDGDIRLAGLTADIDDVHFSSLISVGGSIDIGEPAAAHAVLGVKIRQSNESLVVGGQVSLVGNVGEVSIERCRLIAGGLSLVTTSQIAQTLINIKEWELYNLFGSDSDGGEFIASTPSSSEATWPSEPLVIQGGVVMQAVAGGYVGPLTLFNAEHIEAGSSGTAFSVMAQGSLSEVEHLYIFGSSLNITGSVAFTADVGEIDIVYITDIHFISGAMTATSLNAGLFDGGFYMNDMRVDNVSSIALCSGRGHRAPGTQTCECWAGYSGVTCASPPATTQVPSTYFSTSPRVTTSRSTSSVSTTRTTTRTTTITTSTAPTPPATTPATTATTTSTSATTSATTTTTTITTTTTTTTATTTTTTTTSTTTTTTTTSTATTTTTTTTTTTSTSSTSTIAVPMNTSCTDVLSVVTIAFPTMPYTYLIGTSKSDRIVQDLLRTLLDADPAIDFSDVYCLSVHRRGSLQSDRRRAADTAVPLSDSVVVLIAVANNASLARIKTVVASGSVAVTVDGKSFAASLSTSNGGGGNSNSGASSLQAAHGGAIAGAIVGALIVVMVVVGILTKRARLHPAPERAAAARSKSVVDVLHGPWYDVHVAVMKDDVAALKAALARAGNFKPSSPFDESGGIKMEPLPGVLLRGAVPNPAYQQPGVTVPPTAPQYASPVFENPIFQPGAPLLYTGPTLAAPTYETVAAVHASMRDRDDEVSGHEETGFTDNSSPSSTPMSSSCPEDDEALHLHLHHQQQQQQQQQQTQVGQDAYEWMNRDSRRSTSSMVRNPDIALAMVSSTPLLDVEDPSGNTPLAWAVMTGSVNALRVLLEHGINVNSANIHMQTPLHIACQVQPPHIKIVRQLIAAGAVLDAVDCDGMTPFHHACRAGSLSLIRLLLEAGVAVNSSTSTGITGLMIAAKQGRTEATKYLLTQAMIVPNIRDVHGWTALHWAVATGELTCVKALVENPGVDVTVTTAKGETPLHLAAREGSADAMELLLTNASLSDPGKRRKYLTAVTDLGQAARDLVDGRHEECIAVLEHAGDTKDGLAVVDLMACGSSESLEHEEDGLSEVARERRKNYMRKKRNKEREEGKVMEAKVNHLEKEHTRLATAIAELQQEAAQLKAKLSLPTNAPLAP